MKQFFIWIKFKISVWYVDLYVVRQFQTSLWAATWDTVNSSLCVPRIGCTGQEFHLRPAWMRDTTNRVHDSITCLTIEECLSSRCMFFTVTWCKNAGSQRHLFDLSWSYSPHLWLSLRSTESQRGAMKTASFRADRRTEVSKSWLLPPADSIRNFYILC